MKQQVILIEKNAGIITKVWADKDTRIVIFDHQEFKDGGPCYQAFSENVPVSQIDIKEKIHELNLKLNELKPESD